MLPRSLTCAGRRVWRRAFSLAALGGLAVLAACAGPGRTSYNAPGSALNPWGPYIHEASDRFSIPQSWIRAVMQQESGGHQYMNGHLTRSVHGAVGLMQIKPDTYAELAQRYNLGSDPYNPHDNIMAASGYIRELYDRFGSPDFLGAYNCGPQCMDNHRSRGTPLPGYARTYMAAITPTPERPSPCQHPARTAALPHPPCRPYLRTLPYSLPRPHPRQLRPMGRPAPPRWRMTHCPRPTPGLMAPPPRWTPPHKATPAQPMCNPQATSPPPTAASAPQPCWTRHCLAHNGCFGQCRHTDRGFFYSCAGHARHCHCAALLRSSQPRAQSGGKGLALRAAPGLAHTTGRASSRADRQHMHSPAPAGIILRCRYALKCYMAFMFTFC
ncbi:lytic transglycosylase domain-containing protein [Acetobacter okinawensis]|uniref:lytic transglycosylase domain-containing protein n=1 Tax=Acetobacter okinawensis TaxID=1076594 RepID=UPI000688326E|nr:lytic transglycosylase domain-containing protein [Acetobacter okinawensis]